MTYKVVKEYWTGTRMTEQSNVTSYEEAKGIAAMLAYSRALALPGASVMEGTNGYKVGFPLGDKGRIATDTYFIVEIVEIVAADDS